MTTAVWSRSFVSVDTASYIADDSIQTSDCFVHGPLGTLPAIVSVYTDRYTVEASVFGDLGEGNRRYLVPVAIVPLLIGVASTVGWGEFVSLTLAHSLPMTD